jgi:hypothetical protein
MKRVWRLKKLKTQLLQKITTLSGLGKAGSVESLRLYLKEVDFHIQTLNMRQVIQEKEKMAQPDEPPNMKDRSETITSMRREKRKKEAFSQHRWVIGFEDEPDDENK